VRRFAKNDKANLAPAERESFRRVLETFHDYLRENWPKGWTP
jgi:hypothetical protein